MKAGTQVRAVFGQSVLYGTTKHCVDPDIVVVDIGEPSQVRYLILSDGWSVSVMQEPEPMRGSVVLDRAGDAWQHRIDGWYMANGDAPFTWEYINELFGPVRIVHSPEWDTDCEDEDCGCC